MKRCFLTVGEKFSSCLIWILLNGIWTAGVEVKGQYTTVRLWDEGAYTRGPFETDVNITVLVPPLVTVDGKAHVSDDSEVTLASCFASKSQPAADVMWRLGDLNDSLMTKTNYMLHPDGTFTVVSHLLGAPLRHLNQKTIQCVVTHSTQRTKEYEVDYVINVHYPPELVMIIPDDPTEPKEFHCEADSNPRPSNYTWIKLNESTPHSHGDKLYVPKPASDLNGVYICKVSNQYGSASGVLYVNNQTESTSPCCSVCGFVFISIVCICVVYIFQLKNVSSARQSSSKRNKG
ncbi:nectin-3-like protein [Triplophysa dalaica]|uniref:nectin-3-like protein n=1 Tax=Triplophysa dalaica TaxID=1582913 RepID=UPI0024DF78D9|nr:nectin-3-like protein [Triplophysa dalaica]